MQEESDNSQKWAEEADDAVGPEREEFHNFIADSMFAQ